MATVERLEHNKARLTITVDAAAFESAISKAYFKNGKRYNIPGFRKGHAPRKVIENMYGEGVFYEDAFELVWGEAYDAAMDENGLTGVDQPALDITEIDKEKGVTFIAEVQLRPELTLGAYKGIEVEEPTYTVEDSDVDAELQKERDKSARFVDVDRPAGNGDRVVIDYSGSVDGEKFEGGTAEEQVLVLGSNTFIPGFEEQVAGMKAGEEKDITVTFPESYHAENLAGKEAVFAIKLREVQIKEMPALDDEFAKDVSEFDTLEALRADHRAKLEEKAKKNRETAIENAALKTVCDNATVELPDVMIDRQVNYMLRDIAYRLSMSGISFEDYCKYAGTTLEDMKKNYRPEAAERVKMQLVIDAVEKAEGLVCEDADYESALAEMAQQNGLSAEEFAKGVTDEDKEYVRERALADKAVKCIVGSVKLVAPKATPAATAAAKPDTEAEKAE